MDTVARAARHVGTTAGPAEQALRRQAYHNRRRQSTTDRLEELGAVLLSALRSRGAEQELSVRCLRMTLSRHLSLRAGEVVR